MKCKTIRCESCNKEFNVVPYKWDGLMSKRLPASHIEHKCGGDNK